MNLALRERPAGAATTGLAVLGHPLVRQPLTASYPLSPLLLQTNGKATINLFCKPAYWLIVNCNREE